MENIKYKLLALLSHPIQYQAPFFKEISKCSEIDLKVLFCSSWGQDDYKDEGFGKVLKWDIPVLEGYKSEFLSNISPFPDVSTFWGMINPGIIKKIKDEKCDAIWIHGWNSFTNWLSMFTAFSYNVPVLLRAESNLLNESLFLKKILKQIGLKNLFKKVAGLLSIGSYNSEFYKYYGASKEKIFNVPYCVNNDFFISKAKELLPRKSELKKKFGLPLDLPIILFSGKLIDVKRPMNLLKAYAQVFAKYKCALVYVGDGKLRKMLEGYARENNLEFVYFMGFRNQTELPEFYAMSDIFVLPSSSEPWGLVVNEAMCFGLPVIVSDKVGAGGDLVKEGMNGFIYPSCDVSMLAEKLNVLLSDRAFIQKMGKVSQEVISKWSYREGVRGILQCLKSVVVKNNN